MTEQESKLVGWARNNSFTAASIATFYQNVEEKGGTRVVLDAIAARMRIDFPGQAKKIFGAKEADVVEQLTRVAVAVSQDFPLHDNRVGAHVKTGGAEISRTRFLCRYITYKNAQHHGAGLSLEQDTPDSDIKVYVSRYQTHAGDGNFKDATPFAYSEFAAAEALYRQYLGELTRT